MNSYPVKLTMCCAFVTGAALWGGMAVKFASEDKLSYEPNVACLKGSPYGKIFALAMQGPIGFYWHEGKTHEHASTLADDHEHHAGCADGCHGHGVKADFEPVKKDVPLHEWAQQEIRQMDASTHRTTNGQPLSTAHKQYLQDVTEDKLRLAYELDPTNYTNYANYHLFISTASLGRPEVNDADALALARRTLDTCKKDGVDPASWVTAASAAYNIIYHIGKHHQDFSALEAKASLAEFDACIFKYEQLLDQAFDEGLKIAPIRMKEMKESVSYLIKLRKAQGIYMKRIMSAVAAH